MERQKSTHRQVYEEGQYYNEETSIVDGRKDESVESEQWSRGSPRAKQHFYDKKSDHTRPAPARPRRSRDHHQQQTLRQPQPPSPAVNMAGHYYRRDNEWSPNFETGWAPKPFAFANDPPPYTHDRPFAPPPEFSSIHRSRQLEKLPLCGGTTSIRAGSPGRVAGTSEITNTEMGFTIRLDVSHFRPEEIKVSLVESTLVVEGDHIEGDGQNESLKRSFNRKYNLPDDIEMSSIASTVNDYGILTVKGTRKLPKGWRETEIPIQVLGSSKQTFTSIPRPTYSGAYSSDV
uniref:SHSP domain-containing protein n=1 Tax=Plectus sambesii TaxID=2011161 RepID=A0A914X9J2_9BILA